MREINLIHRRSEKEEKKALKVETTIHAFSQTAFILPEFIRAGLCIRVCRRTNVWLKAMNVGSSATDVQKNFGKNILHLNTLNRKYFCRAFRRLSK